MFSDHSGIKLEICSRKITGKSPKRRKWSMKQSRETKKKKKKENDKVSY
jgi:hypothetical protein